MSGNLNKTFFLLLEISISSTHLKNPGILNCIRLILSQIAIKMGLTCKHQIFELAFPIYLPLFCGMGRWNMSKVLDLIAKGSHMNRRSHTDCFFFLFLFFSFSLSPSLSFLLSYKQQQSSSAGFISVSFQAQLTDTYSDISDVFISVLFWHLANLKACHSFSFSLYINFIFFFKIQRIYKYVY